MQHLLTEIGNCQVFSQLIKAWNRSIATDLFVALVMFISCCQAGLKHGNAAKDVMCRLLWPFTSCMTLK